MDPHLIYTISRSIKDNKIHWIKASNDSEWVHFGVNKQIAIDIIDNHFSNELLYVVFTRRKSVQTAKIDIEKMISALFGFQNFSIWDAEFKKIAQFNSIGTVRIGLVKD